MHDQTATADPFLIDSDRLQQLADEAVVGDGLDDFKDKRVTDVGCAGNRLFAEVEDASSGQLLSLSIGLNDVDIPVVDCPCEDASGLCRHAVAALYAYAAGREGEVGLRGAEESAIAERRERGRTEVKVSKLDGEPWFGTWRARTISKATHYPRDYTVHVRSLTRRANYCNCPDFAVNQLGTCKHVEAVLHRIAQRRDFERLKTRSAPVPYIYLDWELDDGPWIRVHRGGAVPQELHLELEQAFDAAGRFRGRLPDDFFRLADRLDGRGDVHVGADAVAHARFLAAADGHRARAAEIRKHIGAAGGQLPGVQARLYPYQMEGAAFLAGNGRALLADDMGLGKTLQAISAAVWLHRHAGAERVLIVCPASLKGQWAREIERFTGIEAQVVQGPAQARHPQYRRGSGFTIVNYELVLRDLEVINAVLVPDLLILDEAQRIKNWRTKLAAAVKHVASRYAFVLSGTPLENRLEDLYSLMQVVDQRALGPLWRYLADFHITDERGKVLGYRNLSELRRRLAPLMLRRDRRLVRDQLPERIEQRLDVPMTAAQRDLHDAALAGASRIAQIARRRLLTPGEQNRLMAALQQARMACDAVGLVDKDWDGDDSPKLDELATLLDELCLQGGLKAVVFSQWQRMTELAERRLRAIGLGCVRLHGGVPSARRGELIDRFRDDDSVQVFISTDAGGSGLNLQNASVMVNLDVPWNPAVLEQRIARVHRLGQKTRVQSVLMVAADSYEQRVLALVGNKRELFDNVIDPDAQGDVVGVSRKLLETLIDDLATVPAVGRAGDADEAGAPPPEAAAADEMAADLELGAEIPAESPDDVGPSIERQLQRTLEHIQEIFGPRIERVLGSGGGVLVVLDRVDAAADEAAQALSGEFPVAVIDPRTLASLQRLGAASPLGEARILLEARAEPAEPPGARLAAQAREKLRAAGLLLDQACAGPAMELLVSALLAAAAGRAGLAVAPEPADAAVWLYGEAVPRGILDAQQAALVQRAVGLALAPSLPEALLRTLYDEAGPFIG
ncbi:MAG: SWIM zinc finger family protein [Rhodocyclaceae bacterium]|nr:SWIM zinc finger family protein [Rhodocyclaceae bacterium]